MLDYTVGQVSESPENCSKDDNDAIEGIDVDVGDVDVDVDVMDSSDPSGVLESSTITSTFCRRRIHQLRYLSVEDGGDGVGVLEAGHQELENGALTEPAATPTAEPVPGPDQDEGNRNDNENENENVSNYTLHQFGYRPTRQLIRQRQAFCASSSIL